MKRPNAALCLIGCLLMLSGCQALTRNRVPMTSNLYLPKIFGDHMVLQQGRKIPVWGWADPGTRVEVQLERTHRSAIAGRDGRWRVDLPRRKAGGPYQLQINGLRPIVFDDVMIGEVWLCSGQSNMAWPMTETDGVTELEQPEVGEGLRIFRTDPDASPIPRTDVRFTDGWQTATSATLADFSAVAYWFGKKLHAERNVTVGLVQNAVRGSRIEAWISNSSLRQFREFIAPLDELPATVEELDQRYRNEEQQYLHDIRLWRSMIEKADRGKSERWHKTNRPMVWNATQVPGTWQDSHFPLRSGVVWYRKDFMLDQMQSENFTSLHLGKIGEQDVTYLNGKRIGGTKSESAIRRYHIASDALQEGRNTLIIRVMNYESPGGFLSEPDRIRLDVNPSSAVQSMSLAGDWEYRVGVDVSDLLEMPTMPEGHRSDPSVLSNALLEPLIPYAIRGVLWYQGEQNTDYPQPYYSLFPALIADWRARWQQRDLPFIYAQLPNLGGTKATPGESNWAVLRDAQRKTLSKTKKTAMAVLIDLGEPNNIHPYEKHDVGLRLCEAALAVAYGEEQRNWSGPLIQSIEIEDQQLRLHFQHLGSGLSISGKYKELRGFALAGVDGVFHWADARIEDDTVLVSTDQVPAPRRIRYGWDDNPPVNLINREGLPASPFEETLPQSGNK